VSVCRCGHPAHQHAADMRRFSDAACFVDGCDCVKFAAAPPPPRQFDGLTFAGLREANAARQADYGLTSCADWTFSDWATALAGEVGELCNLVKKLRRGDTIDRADIARELADVVIYADLFAQRFDFHLAAEVRQKFNEVSERIGSDVRLT
jgi:NTP pyrophosphatase (non-canonical NTP hydrolase)